METLLAGALRAIAAPPDAALFAKRLAKQGIDSAAMLRAVAQEVTQGRPAADQARARPPACASAQEQSHHSLPQPVVADDSHPARCSLPFIFSVLRNRTPS